MAVAAVLIVVALFVLEDAAAMVVLACGFIALFGAAIRLISRNDTRPPEERRVPGGPSGV